MSLKTISIGALARALAATSVLGATLVPAVAAAQLSPAQQASALAQAIALAVQNAVQNSTADTMEANVQAAIAAAIDGADPQIAKAALAQAQTLVSSNLPAAAQQSVSLAFATETGVVTASIDAGTGAIGGNNGNNANGNGRTGNAGNGIGGGPLGGAPLGNAFGYGSGGGGGGGGSHRVQ